MYDDSEAQSTPARAAMSHVGIYLRGYLPLAPTGVNNQGNYRLVRVIYLSSFSRKT